MKPNRKAAILKKIDSLDNRMMIELEEFIDYLNFKQKKGSRRKSRKNISQTTFGSIKIKDRQLAKYIAEDKELEYET